MKSLALQQVSSPFARRNAGKTLVKPIGLKYVAKFLSEPLLKSLAASCPDGRLYVWGAKAERAHQTGKMLGRGTLFLFRRGSQIYKYGVMIEKDQYNEPLALELWGRDTDGQTWPTIFFFARVIEKTAPAKEINAMLKRNEKYHWQGLVALIIKESPENDEFFRKQLEGL